MERRARARTFARPPLRSAVPPGLGARKGQWKERGRARTFARPPLRSVAPLGLVARKGQWKERLRADFCAPSFEERRSPGTGGQEGPMERRGCARTFACPPLRSAVPAGLVARKGQWKESLRADFCAPSFEERRSAGAGGQKGPMERRGCPRTFARPPSRSAVPPRLATRKGPWKEEAARGLLRALL